MDFKDCISSRLNKEEFYYNSYYKFEKYNQLKKKYQHEHPSTFLYDFGIGEGDELPPSFVLSRLGQEIWKYENRVYADNGIEPFIQACAIHLKEIYHVSISSPNQNICPCMGAKSALCILPLAFISKNDIVITTTPSYTILANMAKWEEATIYEVPLRKQNQYLIDLESIPEEIYQKCKIFSINYPNNPTGGVATKEFYEALIAKALKYHFMIVNDAAYGPFTYNAPPLSILSIPHAFETCVEIHSFSKAFNMSGMRIGFIAGNEQIIDIFKKVKDNVDSGQYIPIQLAACEAIYHEKNYLRELKTKYYTRLKKVASIFSSNHLPCEVSKGAFYLYIPVPPSFRSASFLASYLLQEAGIFTIPYEEVSPHLRLSMTFLLPESEENFYKELNKRLKILQ